MPTKPALCHRLLVRIGNRNSYVKTISRGINDNVLEAPPCYRKKTKSLNNWNEWIKLLSIVKSAEQIFDSLIPIVLNYPRRSIMGVEASWALPDEFPKSRLIPISIPMGVSLLPNLTLTNLTKPNLTKPNKTYPNLTLSKDSNCRRRVNPNHLILILAGNSEATWSS